MKVKNYHIVNAFTNLEGLIQDMRNGPLDIFLSPKRMFDMGRFYQWAKPIIENDDTDLEATTEVPEEFAWVVEEALKLY